MRDKYQIEIENKIKNFDYGYAFTATDFKEIADTDPTNKALSRLCESGIIRRVIQGVYDKPVYSAILKANSAPDVDSVVAALARKFNWTIAPDGETALNYLRLSTQISNEWSYISDGPYRKYEIEPYTIEFKHCANKEISGRSYITIIVIQALKYIGNGNIQREDVERLSQFLSKEEKTTILSEAYTATSWIYRILKEICGK